MKVLHWIAMILIVIGALNWGMWGFFQIDVISRVFGGSVAPISRVIFGLIGLAGIWALIFFFRHICCKCCYPNGKGKKSSCCK